MKGGGGWGGGGEEERRMNERNVCEGEGEKNVIAV